MWRSKKFIIVAVLAVVVLGGSIGGVALARTESGSPAGMLLAQNVSENTSQRDVLLVRVAEILQEQGIDITSEQLQDAFVQARSEMRTEALKNRLQSLVNEGRITQKQADQYLEWWQAKPDVPVKFGFGGHGGFRGMGGLRGFGGPCAPAE